MKKNGVNDKLIENLFGGTLCTEVQGIKKCTHTSEREEP